MALKPKQLHFLDLFRAKYGDIRIAQRQDIVALCEEHDLPWPSWLTANLDYRAGRGEYRVPVSTGEVDPRTGPSFTPEAPALVAAKAAPSPEFQNAVSDVTLIQRINGSERFIPDKASWFVPWGHFKDLTSVVKSRLFFPVFVTGMSGNGKTLGIEQVCAKLKRELFRVNITGDTDEDDLLGGFRLIDGNTVFVPGPVVEAMERGAILLLDEMDLGTFKIMCLQPVLEGKGVFLKKVGRWVKPQPGFNVFATGNTKGQGDNAGKFIGTNVMNEAMLDRFPVTFHQPYPSLKQERKILAKHMVNLGVDDDAFGDCLVQWASNIRKTAENGEIEDIITTRRLVNVLTCFAIYKDRVKSIKLVVERFDDDTKAAFLDLYTKIDAEANADDDDDTADGTPVTVASTSDDDECPF
ncbi:MAG: AAA family ATPase [candidate division Zixibacteria bacterium]|nr:AAA family ATPase [candidate division Zixibacteria bacterium]